MNMEEYMLLSDAQKKKLLAPSKTEEGYAYKLNKKWSDIKMNEIVYVPEMGYAADGKPVDVYTKETFIDECGGNNERASCVYDNITWTYPETLYLDTDWEEYDEDAAVPA